MMDIGVGGVEFLQALMVKLELISNKLHVGSLQTAGNIFRPSIDADLNARIEGDFHIVSRSARNVRIWSPSEVEDRHNAGQ